MTRPWCACSKLHLADERHVRVIETGKRLTVHSFDKCTTFRTGKEADRAAVPTPRAR